MTAKCSTDRTDPGRTDRWLVPAYSAYWLALIFWEVGAILVALLRAVVGTTASQWGFLASAALVVPAMSVVAFATGRGRSRVTQALAVALLGGGALAVGAAATIMIYPAYPDRGPHEMVGVAFSLPAVASSAAGLAMTSTSFRQRVTVAGVLAGAGAIVLALVYRISASPFVLALPASVTEIRRASRSDLQDFDYSWREVHGIAEKDADRVVRRLGLSPTDAPLKCHRQFSRRDGELDVRTWPVSGRVYVLDETVEQTDIRRYPEGRSGCYTNALWRKNVLCVCEICSWGI